MPNAATTTKIANRLNLKGLCGCYIIPLFNLKSTMIETKKGGLRLPDKARV